MKNDEKSHRKALKNEAKRRMREEESKRARKAELDAKYEIQNTPRMGQKQNAVILVLGKPAAIDRTVTKRCIKEVLKYQPFGSNRYKLKITFENGCVSGWESKE